MDIIAAHRQGLIEQLEEEVAALAGRPRDHVQRAVVLHHLYDHSRGALEWALIEARRELRIASGLNKLRQRLKRWGWLTRRRAMAAEALVQLADAIGHLSRSRCVAVHSAYRLSGVSTLHDEAEQILPQALLASLAHCHACRRAREAVAADAKQQLGGQCEELAARACADSQLEAAWAAIMAAGLGRAAQRLIGEKALDRAAARDRKHGMDRVERELRADVQLPAAFRANPAQHFYRMQLLMAEKRRQQWREACDQEPDAFELAA
jgi:hypothetical protein